MSIVIFLVYYALQCLSYVKKMCHNSLEYNTFLLSDYSENLEKIL